MIDNNWVRVTTAGGILPAAGLSGTPLELAAAGHTPESLGMLSLKTATQRVGIPEIDAFGISLNIPTEARFTDDNGNELFGVAFTDEHADEWLAAIAQQGRALIVIADHVAAHYPTITDWFSDAWMAMVPAALYAWPEGVGITAPGPQK